MEFVDETIVIRIIWKSIILEDAVSNLILSIDGRHILSVQVMEPEVGQVFQ